MRAVTDAKVRRLMEEMSKHGCVGLASMRAGIDRKTGRKYVAVGELPSERVEEPEWRTREDPFASHWEAVVAGLVETPPLEGKALFDLLVER